MPAFHVYVTEPEAINLEIVRKAFGATSHMLVAGNTDFSVGEPANCDTILIRSASRIDASVRQHLPHLRHIVRVGTGLDNIDLTFCNQADIAVYNAPGANAEAVAEYAVTVSLLALRRLHRLTRADVEHWNRFAFTGRSIATRSVGIVGFGHIGRLVYHKLRALGCSSFLLHDPFATEAPADARLAPLDELLAHSDIISLHLPLTSQTHHLIGADKLAILKPDAILLNASRGGIVDETAVLAALHNKQFTYIADTVEGEPRVRPALLDHPDIIVTPHIASLTEEADAAMIRTAIENLVAGTVATPPPA